MFRKFHFFFFFKKWFFRIFKYRPKSKFSKHIHYIKSTFFITQNKRVSKTGNLYNDTILSTKKARTALSGTFPFIYLHFVSKRLSISGSISYGGILKTVSKSRSGGRPDNKQFRESIARTKFEFGDFRRLGKSPYRFPAELAFGRLSNERKSVSDFPWKQH